MNDKPIWFGVQWAPAIPGAELSDFVKELEGLGFYSIGFPDHYFIGRKNPIPLYEPFTTMGYAAAASTTLRLVSIVACNDFRHPALFARSTANLDVLSDGRVEAGIGAGWYEPEYEGLGTPFDAPSVRIARLGEALQIIKAYWTEEKVEFEGKFYKVPGLPGVPKPVQKPHPRVLIGAGGRKMLQLAGRQADVVGLTSSLRDYTDREAMEKDFTRSAIQKKIDIVRQAARDANRDPEEIVIQQQLREARYDGDQQEPMWNLAGDASQMIDELEARREMGITYYMLQMHDRTAIREFGERVVSKL